MIWAGCFCRCVVQVFTAIFAAEAALKITALGLFRYLKERWNCFDLFVVSMSLIEFGLSGNKAFSILRSFRLVRRRRRHTVDCTEIRANFSGCYLLLICSTAIVLVQRIHNKVTKLHYLDLF